MDKEKGLVVLSLFDGISGAQQALERAGIKVAKYYASEIDKYAMKVTMHNYPETVMLGDVVLINIRALGKIDLLIGGSPCQGFSFAGKQLNFNDPRSKLFFDFARVWEEVKAINPDAKFLLENVEMKEEHELVISKIMGVNPVVINSKLVSAQNRVRNYWTNIGMQPQGLFGDLYSIIKQPLDKGIYLLDILQEDAPEKYYLSNKAVEYLLRDKMNERFVQSEDNEKSGCVVANYYKGVPYNVISVSKGVLCDEGELVEFDKVPALTASYSKGWNRKRSCGMVEVVAIRGRKASGENNYVQKVELNKTGKTNTLTSVEKDNLLVVTHNLQPRRTKGVGGKGPLSKKDGKSYCLDAQANQAVELVDGNIIQKGRGYNKGGLFTEKSPTLTINSWEHNNHVTSQKRLRRLTPKECCRLQTVKDDYFWDANGKNVISETQMYKALGNGFTIDVIAHILSYI